MRGRHAAIVTIVTIVIIVIIVIDVVIVIIISSSLTLLSSSSSSKFSSLSPFHPLHHHHSNHPYHLYQHHHTPHRLFHSSTNKAASGVSVKLSGGLGAGSVKEKLRLAEVLKQQVRFHDFSLIYVFLTASNSSKCFLTVD